MDNYVRLIYISFQFDWISRACWAFAAISSLEGQISKKLGVHVTLSEQQLIDCSKSNYACNGGDPMLAFNDVLTKKAYFNEKSVSRSSAYPVRN